MVFNIVITDVETVACTYFGQFATSTHKGLILEDMALVQRKHSWIKKWVDRNLTKTNSRWTQNTGNEKKKKEEIKQPSVTV